jgi:hypothetical protein
VAPRLIPRLFSTQAAQRFMFRTISQTAVHYRGCALSSGAAGRLQGGDRLPWVRLGARDDPFRDNYEPLGSVAWQMHLYGEASAEVERYCDEQRFTLHVFPWRPAMDATRLVRNALYLVRPDGYIAAITRPRAA